MSDDVEGAGAGGEGFTFCGKESSTLDVLTPEPKLEEEETMPTSCAGMTNSSKSSAASLILESDKLAIIHLCRDPLFHLFPVREQLDLASKVIGQKNFQAADGEFEDKAGCFVVAGDGRQVRKGGGSVGGGTGNTGKKSGNGRGAGRGFQQNNGKAGGRGAGGSGQKGGKNSSGSNPAAAAPPPKFPDIKSITWNVGLGSAHPFLSAPQRSRLIARKIVGAVSRHSHYILKLQETSSII